LMRRTLIVRPPRVHRLPARALASHRLESHCEAGAALLSARAHLHGRAVQASNLLDDGEPEPASLAIGIRYPIEALEDAGALLLRDPGSVVHHRELGLMASLDDDRDPSGASSIAERVIDQVRQELAQQTGIAIDGDRALGHIEPEVDIALERARDPFLADPSCEGNEVGGLELEDRERFRVGARQGEKLLTQARGSLDG